MSSLLDDLEEDHHKFLLAEGNLHVKRSTWTGHDVWESQGYVARLNRITCECGAVHLQFLGIFHREFNPARNATKEQVLHAKSQIPQNQNWPREINEIPAGICPSCYSFKGFQEI